MKEMWGFKVVDDDMVVFSRLRGLFSDCIVVSGSK